MSIRYFIFLFLLYGFQAGANPDTRSGITVPNIHPNITVFDFQVVIHFSEDLSKNRNLVPTLAMKCKTSEEGCNLYEQQILLTHALYFCGEEAYSRSHPLARQYFVSYMNNSTINTSILRTWGLIGGRDGLLWATCAVCLFDYPNDPYWDMNVSACEER